MLNDNSASIKLFDQDEELHEKMSSPYVAILSLLEYIMSRLSSTKSKLSSLSNTYITRECLRVDIHAGYS
jgi:hypothetical protein